MTQTIPNVLAERYASPELKALWTPRARLRLERELWLAVLRAQGELGLPAPAAAVAAYEAALDEIDEADIARRERASLHDVKARIESYNAAAGHELIHRGMTSRDLTENVEQLQVYRTLGLFRRKAAAAVLRLAARAEEAKHVVLAARTHNVVAQATTLGRRWAMFLEEFWRAARQLDHWLAAYPARGLKGAVGTQLDQLTLLDGDAARAAALDRRVAAHLGLPDGWLAPGQVYGRSLDLQIVQLYLAVAAPAASFATTLRLMAGQELASEGFAPGQTGSSAMPHKMNARSSERINGFYTILQGHAAMAGALAGHQWNEGDVSCSVVRRVLLPDSAFALDGLLETFLTVLGQMEAIPEAIAAENARYAPFLASTTLLMAAVKAGAGREQAHAAVKEHAVAALKALRAGAAAGNDLPARLAADPRLGLPRAEIDRVIAAATAETGLAAAQTEAAVAAARAWAEGVPGAADVRPAPIL